MKDKPIARMHLLRGLTLYECNAKTGVITEAEVVDGKVFTKKDCLYRQFLNMKTAIKKFSKLLETYQQPTNEKSTSD